MRGTDHICGTICRVVCRKSHEKRPLIPLAGQPAGAGMTPPTVRETLLMRVICRRISASLHFVARLRRSQIDAARSHSARLTSVLCAEAATFPALSAWL